MKHKIEPTEALKSEQDIKFTPVKDKRKRKKRLLYRPPIGTVLDIDEVNFKHELQEQDINLQDVSFLNHLFMECNRVICIAGAGISVGAGIPDFRSSNGLFSNLNDGQGKNLFDYQAVYRDQETMSRFHKMVHDLYQMSMEGKPTLFHKFLDYLSGDGRLLRLYTQNIDLFELQLPHLQTLIPLQLSQNPPKCIQLHGNVQIMNCTKCHYRARLDPKIFLNLTSNSPPPLCPECVEMDAVREIAGKRKLGGGSLRPRIVLYNEFHPDGEIIGKISQKDLKLKPDCLVIVGTTLKIPGVRVLLRELTRMIHNSKGCVVWVNKEEPSTSIVDYLEYLDLIVIGDCQDIPKLLVQYQVEINDIKDRKRRKVSSKTN